MNARMPYADYQSLTLSQLMEKLATSVDITVREQQVIQKLMTGDAPTLGEIEIIMLAGRRVLGVMPTPMQSMPPAQPARPLSGGSPLLVPTK